MTRWILVLTIWSFLLGFADAQQIRKPPSLQTLIKQLGAAKKNDRLDATEWIADLGPKAAKAGPALTRLLDDPAIEVKVSAAIALLKTGADPKIVMPVLKLELDYGEFPILSELLRRGYQRKKVLTQAIQQYMALKVTEGFGYQQIFAWLGEDVEGRQSRKVAKDCLADRASSGVVWWLRALLETLPRGDEVVMK